MAEAVIQRFRRNWEGFWSAYRWYFYVFTIAIFCDALSTMYFMHRDGADLELHPVYRLAACAFGYTVGPFLGFLSKLMGGMVVCVYFRRWAAVIFTIVSLISFWACWYNVWGRDFVNTVDLLALIQK